MTAKRFTIEKYYQIKDNETNRYYESSDVDDGVALHDLLNELHEENQSLKKQIGNLEHTRDFCADVCADCERLEKENEELKAQLYCDDEEGVCNICKHHYLVKDDEVELGYYNSRCKKGHYECPRVSLKYCEDFEKELEE